MIMIKKILGFILLMIASLSTIYLTYGIFSNPNSLLLFVKLVTGEFGLLFTIVSIGTHFFMVLTLVLSFKIGINWMNFYQEPN